MTQRVLQYSKVMLFFSFALVAALFITQQLLEAHDSEEPVLSIDQMATQNALQYVDGDELRQKLEDKIRRADEEKEMLTLESRECKLYLQAGVKSGRPVVLLAAGRIRGVDGKGNILALQEDEPIPNLPVITGPGLRFNTHSRQLDGFLFHQAMAFISEVNGRSSLLGQKLSEVHCDPELGLVAYFSQTGMLPVLLGQDDLAAKARNLDVFLSQLGPSTLM
ncbi:MAG TPA: cell division protein FtsQ/DivIB, partial [bacterium]|nr:cell division protein FtsQ/DivIB [bacterium]